MASNKPPILPPRFLDGAVGKEIGNWILAELREALMLAGINGRYIDAVHIVGTLPALIARIIVYVNKTYIGARAALNFSSNFTAAVDDDVYLSNGAAIDIDLSNTAVTPGAYGDASFYPTFVVDAKGRITGAGEIALAAGATLNQRRLSIAFQFGDDTNVIDAATERDQWLSLNFSGVIEGWALVADGTGSVIIDVWVSPYAAAPPTIGYSIVGGNKPTLSTEIVAQDSVLTYWTTAFARGDVVLAHVDSASSIKAVTLTLLVVKD